MDKQSQFSLPTAQDWHVWGNGFPATISLSSVDADGTVQGWIKDDNGNLPLEQASWNETTKQFIFRRTLPNGEIQTFTGDLFDTTIALDQSGSVYNVLAGTFVGDRFEDPGRPNFGWFALNLANPIQ